MKTCSDSKHTVVFLGFFKHIFSNLKEKKLVQKSGLMQKCDSMLCSCLFSSSNKNKILRVTFFLKKKKTPERLFGYQDVQTHDFVCLSNSARPVILAASSENNFTRRNDQRLFMSIYKLEKKVRFDSHS